MTDVNKKLALRLQELRANRSLYRVGKDLNISRSLLSRYESGEHVPEDEALKKLASYYGETFEALKSLYFDDLYPLGSENRKVLETWIKKSDR